MADRLAALGGTLAISSQPGRGTTLSGALPVDQPRPVPSADAHIRR
jgi:signal transduction histidine kinase